MINKILTILSINDKIKFYFLFVIIFFVLFVEMIGIGLLPIYVVLISDPISFVDKIPVEIINFEILNLENDLFIMYSTLALFVIFFLKNFLLGLFIYLQGKIIMAFNRKTSSYLFNHYVNSNYMFYLNTNPAKIIRILNTDIGLSFNLIQSILKLLREGLIVTSILIAMLIVNFKIYFSTFLLFAIFLLIFYFLFKDKLKKKGQLSQTENAQNIKIINQSFNSLKEIKISRSENFFLNLFNESVKKLQGYSFFNYLVTTLPRLFLEIFAIGIITIFTLSFFYFNYSIENFIPLISLLAVACVRFIPAFNNIVSSINTIKFYSPSVEVISKEINNFKKEKKIKEVIKSDKFFSFNKKIELKNVNFNYNNQNNILNDVNLTLEKGGIYAFSGPSGSGKTTLINLILGFLEPTNGKIFVDDFELSNNINKWQTKIGYIPQNIYLLDETLRENIAFGIPRANIKQNNLDRAIKDSRLDKVVEAMPNGLDTKLGNMGSKISGGQRQRIAISRALYNDPEILIFDEATNSLDKKIENEIYEDVIKNKGSKTILIISHQKIHFDKFDKIYEIENGKLNKT